MDLHSLFKDVCGRYLQTVATSEQLPVLLDNAMRTAISERVPTCLIVPHDVQRADAVDDLPHTHGVVPSSAVTAGPACCRAPTTCAAPPTCSTPVGRSRC
ncbi:hypothetical protein ACFV4N_35130 [Actinosynnema sp. NPDC059797]